MRNNGNRNGNNSDVIIDNFAAVNNEREPSINSAEDIDGIGLAIKMNIVRQIWLAGLGAYSYSIDELHIAGDKSSMFFEQLLRQGEKVDRRFKLHSAGEHISLNGLEKLLQRSCVTLARVEQNKVERDKITRLNDKLDYLLLELERHNSAN